MGQNPQLLRALALNWTGSVKAPYLDGHRHGSRQGEGFQRDVSYRYNY